MIVLDLAAANLVPIVEFESRGAASAELAAGRGEAHVHVVHIEAGGAIGPHVAGFGQLFVCLDGNGWVAGADGERHVLRPGQAAYFARGKVHSKGSDAGLRALILQVESLEVESLE